MRVVTPSQMKQIDNTAINDFGIPGIVLMENAGAGVAREILKLPLEEGKSAALIGGKGNNGGDVMVTARHLANNGMDVNVYLLAKKEEVRGDAQTNLAILDRMGIRIIEITKEDDLDILNKGIKEVQIIVDGLFGTGLKGEIGGLPRKVIDLINNSKKFVVAADIPSGIDGETGQICGVCVQAQLTVTFGYPKVGLLQYPGAAYAGKIIVSDISIPGTIDLNTDININALTAECIRHVLPHRKPDAHKGTSGRVLLIGGSEGMTGAVALAAAGCLKSGAGLIKAAVPGGLNQIMESKLTEVMTVPVGDKYCVRFRRDAREKLGQLMKEAHVVGIGPGMGVDDGTADIVEFVVQNAGVPLVVDADALNCIALDLDILKKAAVPIVVTPHPGEMARLMKCSVMEIQKDRIKAAGEFSGKWRVVTVLKGANSVIADPLGNIYINTTGNRSMASGGMGDVLTGIIASFISQGVDPVGASCAGTYIHGLAGDLLSHQQGYFGITASELAGFLPMAVKLIKEGSGDHDGKGHYDKGSYYSEGN